jgi:hypothetical protein
MRICKAFMRPPGAYGTPGSLRDPQGAYGTPREPTGPLGSLWDP